MINKEKIKAKVRKAIKKLPTEVEIKRAIKNDFGEETDITEIICNVEGLYHEGTSVNITLQDKGETKSDKGIYFLVVYDEYTELIRKNDFFVIDNMKYIIKDLGNINKMGIYLDMKLQEGGEIE